MMNKKGNALAQYVVAMIVGLVTLSLGGIMVLRVTVSYYSALDSAVGGNGSKLNKSAKAGFDIFPLILPFGLIFTGLAILTIGTVGAYNEVRR